MAKKNRMAAVTPPKEQGGNKTSEGRTGDSQNKNKDNKDATSRMAGAKSDKDKGSGGLKTKKLPSQALQLQMAIADLGKAQTESNATFMAGIEERLGKFNTGQTIDIARATGTEERLNMATQGTQSRANILATGEQERATIGTTGEQQRLTQAQRYAGETGLIRTTGEESRRGIETTGTQQRLTDLQTEMFRRYKENRDYEQAQTAYRT